MANRYIALLTIILIVISPSIYANTGKSIDDLIAKISEIKSSSVNDNNKDFLRKMLDKELRAVRNFLWLDLSEDNALSLAKRLSEMKITELAEIASLYIQVEKKVRSGAVPQFNSQDELNQFIQNLAPLDSEDIDDLALVLLANRRFITADYKVGQWQRGDIYTSFRKFGLELGYVQYPTALAY